MPVPTLPRRKIPPFTPYLSDVQMMDADPMLFDFDDVSFNEQAYPDTMWDMPNMDLDVKPQLDMSSACYAFDPPSTSTDNLFDPPFYSPDGINESPSFNNDLYLSNWVHDTDIPSPSSPIPIPASPQSQSLQFPYPVNRSCFPAHNNVYSPSTFAALHPLPSSASPISYEEGLRTFERPRVDSISPSEISIATPSWATQLWESESPKLHTRAASSRSPVRRHSPLSSPHRLRIPGRDSASPVNAFQSSSAPPFGMPPQMARGYSSGKAESSIGNAMNDRDATVRRKRKISDPEGVASKDKDTDTLPLKSVIRPPKLAPSAWQLYFTDWIQRQQATNTRKLNVAQAAKEAGQEYAGLTVEEKEPYKRRSQAMKEARERELSAYMRTLTPDDIKRENAFRAAQRKAGKSRKSNIKDPNAPKKPLSAYFMFLQRIRASPQLVQEIFGDESETTKQSVLAAAKWRSMTDDERKPFLAQAEQEKMEYEAARRLYEEGTPALGTTINFSILPGSPMFGHLKMDSESESDGFATDDDRNRYRR